MDNNKLAYAALVLPDAGPCALDPYVTTATTVISELDPMADGGASVAPNLNTVMGARFGAHVWFDSEGDYGPRVVFDLMVRDGVDLPMDDAAQILADIVLDALDFSDADIVEWFAADTLYDREDFQNLRVYAAPEKAQRAFEELGPTDGAEFRNVLKEDAEEAIDQRANFADRVNRLKDMPGSEIRMKSAGWAMTGVLATVVTPVGAAMAVMGLLRGMEVRLVARVMGVTGLFMALHHTDALNRVLRQLLY